MKNKSFILIILGVLLCGEVCAQAPTIARDSLAASRRPIWVKGRMIDTKNKSAAALREFGIYDASAPDTLITRFLTSAKGTFFFKVKPLTQRFYIRAAVGNAIASIGLQEHVLKDTVVNVGDIGIELEVALKEVVISGRRTGVVDVQKRSYSVQSLRTAEAPLLVNFLRTLPGVFLTDGSIIVDGRKVPVFYLNGMISSREVVTTLPLELIEKVEIINRPVVSTRINSEEVIINVVLKQPATLQFGGNVATQQSLVYRGKSGSTSQSIVNKNLFINMSITTYSNNYLTNSSSLWQDNDSAKKLFNDTSASKYAVVPSFNSVTLQYKFSPKLQASWGLYQNFKSIRYKNTSKLQQSSVSYETTTESKIFDNQRIGVAELAFNKNDSTKTILNFGATKVINTINLSNTFDKLSAYNHVSTRSYQRNMTVSYSTQLRHCFVFNRAKIEIGGLYNLYLYESEYKNTLVNQLGESIADLLDDTSYKVTLGSLFSTATLSCLKGELQIGLRGETNLLQTSKGIGTNASHIWYGVPSLSYLRSTDKWGTWIASYSKDITLPDASMVSAGSLNFRPTVFKSGNTSIVPETSNNFELYNIISNNKVDINSNVYINLLNNVIGLYGNEISSNNGLISSYANLGSLSKIGLNVSLTQNLSKKINFNINVRTEFFKHNFDYTTEKKRYIQYNNGAIVNVGIAGMYSYNKSLSANLNISYENYRYTTFSKEYLHTPSFSLKINKSVLKQKLFIAANWTSILNLGQKARVVYFSEAVTGKSNEFGQLQNFALSATYRFGKQGSEVSKTSEPVLPRKIKQ